MKIVDASQGTDKNILKSTSGIVTEISYDTQDYTAAAVGIKPKKLAVTVLTIQTSDGDTDEVLFPRKFSPIEVKAILNEEVSWSEQYISIYEGGAGSLTGWKYEISVKSGFAAELSLTEKVSS